GAAAAFVIVATVISTRVDRRIAESRARYRMILDSMTDAVATFGADGVINGANPAAERMFATEGAALHGQSIDAFLPALGVTAGAGPGLPRETIGRHGDGTEFPADVVLSTLSLGKDRLYSVVVRDITERKRIGRELEEQVGALEAARAQLEAQAGELRDARD